MVAIVELEGRHRMDFLFCKSSLIRITIDHLSTRNQGENVRRRGVGGAAARDGPSAGVPVNVSSARLPLPHVQVRPVPLRRRVGHVQRVCSARHQQEASRQLLSGS
jgi:hypothetical protein